MTVAELLADFEKYYFPTLSPNTQAGYKTNIHNHILPYIGNCDVMSVDRDLLDWFCDILVPLSNTSICYVLATLRSAYSWARRQHFFTSTALETYDFPRHDRPMITVYSDSEMLTLRRACSTLTPISVAVRLALCYGLRRGEILGLSDSSVDFFTPMLFIQRSVVYRSGDPIVTDGKTYSARRGVLLDLADRDFLRSFDQRPSNRFGYFLRDFDGSTYTQNRLYRDYVRLLDDCHLRRIRFHDLRHSYATYMMRHGVNSKIVSSTMGHSSVKVTLDLYSWADTSQQAACLNALKALG